MKLEKTTLQLFEQLMIDYNKNLDFNGVNGKRVATRLSTLANIGLTEENGSNRIGYSLEEQQAKEQVKQWMVEAGLEVNMDGAGNIIGRLNGQNPDLPAILSGSHVDSVPNGGHFDGALGVIGALEVIEAWKETEYHPSRPFEVIIFSDEEGSRFNSGLHGSLAMVGELKKEVLLQKVDIFGEPFEDVVQHIGLSADSFLSAKRDLSRLGVFIEMHIEQGKRLEKADIPIGIVTGIAGPCWLKMSFIGSAGHAGNTPMNDRRDALVGASRFISELATLPPQVSPSAVATVGKLHVQPNGVNVIPGRVDLTVDIRDIYLETRDELVEKVLDLAKSICETHQIELNWSEATREQPIPIDEQMLQKLEKSVKSCGIKPFYLPSGAGHDAMIIGRHIPSAMIFVRSKNGVSHNPMEWSSLNDCIQGIHVLKNFVEQF